MQGSKIVPPGPCKTDCSHCSYECRIKPHEDPTVKQALEKWMRELGTYIPKSETVLLSDALGRIAAETTYSKFDIPRTNSAMHDGIAVKYATVENIEEGKPVTLDADDFSYCPMGSVLPEKFDSIVHAEQCALNSDGTATVYKSPLLYQSVYLKGAVVAKGERLVFKGTKLTPSDLAMLQYCGHTEVSVINKPKIGIIPIGNDLRLPGSIPGPGEYIDSNSLYVASFASQYGAECSINNILPDDIEKVTDAIKEISSVNDMVIVIGGISKGEDGYGDCTLTAVRALGQISSCGIKLGPGGKHMLLAQIYGKPLIGIPGPPHAAITMTEYFVVPAIQRYLGVPCRDEEIVQAVLEHDLPKRGGGESIWAPRLILSSTPEGYTAHITEKLGDTVCNFVDGDAWVEVTGPMENFKKGCIVNARLIRPKWFIEMKKSY